MELVIHAERRLRHSLVCKHEHACNDAPAHEQTSLCKRRFEKRQYTVNREARRRPLLFLFVIQ